MVKAVFKDGRGYWATQFGFYPRQRYPMGYRLPDDTLLDAVTGNISD